MAKTSLGVLASTNHAMKAKATVCDLINIMYANMLNSNSKTLFKYYCLVNLPPLECIILYFFNI